jgi:hypothetical protein
MTQNADKIATKEDLERVLAVDRLLMSVLTPEELEELQNALATGNPDDLKRWHEHLSSGDRGPSDGQ